MLATVLKTSSPTSSLKQSMLQISEILWTMRQDSSLLKTLVLIILSLTITSKLLSMHIPLLQRLLGIFNQIMSLKKSALKALSLLSVKKWPQRKKAVTSTQQQNKI